MHLGKPGWLIVWLAAVVLDKLGVVPRPSAMGTNLQRWLVLQVSVRTLADVMNDVGGRAS